MTSPTVDTTPIHRDKVNAMLLGVLHGDCLGAPYEFHRGPLTGPLTVGRSVFGHPAGFGTDDTETTIAVATGLTTTPLGPDTLHAIAEQLAIWHAGGPADVGNATATGLRRYRDTGSLDSGTTAEDAIANGALMRSAPFAALPITADDAAGLAVASARLTHAHPVVLAGVDLYVRLLHQLLRHNTTPAITAVPAETRAVLVDQPDQIDLPGGGYAPYALSLALWCAHHATNYQSGIDTIVRFGGDTDTNGAICGAILATRFGIPSEATDALAPQRVRQMFALACALTAASS